MLNKLLHLSNYKAETNECILDGLFFSLSLEEDMLRITYSATNAKRFVYLNMFPLFIQSMLSVGVLTINPLWLIRSEGKKCNENPFSCPASYPCVKNGWLESSYVVNMIDIFIYCLLAQVAGRAEEELPVFLAGRKKEFSQENPAVPCGGLLPQSAGAAQGSPIPIGPSLPSVLLILSPFLSSSHHHIY